MEQTENYNKSSQPEKLCLMNSLAHLREKTHAMEALEELSYHLLLKFTNPQDGSSFYDKENSLMEKEKMASGEISKVPNLIELFDQTNESIGFRIDGIETNLRRILEMVD